jgi:hypothetical protein
MRLFKILLEPKDQTQVSHQTTQQPHHYTRHMVLNHIQAHIYLSFVGDFKWGEKGRGLSLEPQDICIQYNHMLIHGGYTIFNHRIYSVGIKLYANHMSYFAGHIYISNHHITKQSIYIYIYIYIYMCVCVCVWSTRFDPMTHYIMCQQLNQLR